MLQKTILSKKNVDVQMGCFLYCLKILLPVPLFTCNQCYEKRNDLFWRQVQPALFIYSMLQIMQIPTCRYYHLRYFWSHTVLSGPPLNVTCVFIPVAVSLQIFLAPASTISSINFIQGLPCFLSFTNPSSLRHKFRFSAVSLNQTWGNSWPSLEIHN